MEERITKLNHAFIFEITKALAIPNIKATHSIIRWFFGKATLRFSSLMIGLEHEIEMNGLTKGAEWLLKHFVSGYTVAGRELIPQDGPLIIASNHPASYDAVVISACIPRSDYKIIIGEIPPYHYLPYLSQYAIFSPPAKNTFGRMQTVRNAIRHLREGGALLIFPRGGIEPDAAFMPNADAEFHQWSRSLDILIRNVPETKVLTTIVSHVISKKIFHHPITWFRKKRPDKQRLAFMYQMILQILYEKELFGLRPHVTFGELLHNLQPKNVLEEIEHAAKRTLEKHLSLIPSIQAEKNS
jgi:1-acyl-sn-glycerol-3-phosphate acyltransferase